VEMEKDIEKMKNSAMISIKKMAMVVAQNV